MRDAIRAQLLVWLIFLCAVHTAYALTAGEWTTKGMKLQDAGDDKSAIRCFGQSIKLQPRNPEAYYYRACSYFDIDNPKAALSDFNKSIKLAPTHANVYIERSQAKCDLHDYKGAEADINTAIAHISPERASLYAYRAEIRWMIPKRDAALSDYAKAIKLEPKNYALYVGRSDMYEALSKTDLRIADLSKAIALKPADYRLYLKRAHAYMQTTVWCAKALEDAEKAISLDASEPLGWWYRALALEATAYNNRTKANQAYSDFIQVAASNPDQQLEVKQARRRIAQSDSDEWHIEIVTIMTKGSMEINLRFK